MKMLLSHVTMIRAESADWSSDLLCEDASAVEWHPARIHRVYMMPRSSCQVFYVFRKDCSPIFVTYLCRPLKNFTSRIVQSSSRELTKAPIQRSWRALQPWDLPSISYNWFRSRSMSSADASRYTAPLQVYKISMLYYRTKQHELRTSVPKSGRALAGTECI